MSGIAARYLAWTVLRAAGLALLVLLALFSFIDLAETLEDVGTGAFTVADALSVLVLTTPARMLELLPVSLLLGSVLGLGLLANQRELVALRAAGMSVWHMGGIVLVLATALALLAAAVQLAVVPMAERRAQEFRTRTLEQTALGSTEFWSRSGARLLRVGAVDFGRIPRNVEIYELDEDARLRHLLRADRADIVSAGTWLLQDVEEKVLDGERVLQRQVATLEWPSFLSPDQLATLVSPADAVSALDLYRYLDQSRGAGLDTREQQVLFWQQVSLPLALLAMGLLGVPLALASVRTRSGGFRTLVGGAIGIGFYLFEQVASHLALLLELAPAPTALAPALVVLAVALIALRRVA